MRRRAQVVPAEHVPPPELLRFEESYWADLAPDYDERVDNWSSEGMTEPGRRAARIFNVWKDARHRWRDQHGWPTDSVDFIVEQRNERLRYVYGEDHFQASQPRPHSLPRQTDIGPKI